ncbi:hypothetical protein GMORB2_3945 [Geosmithia morbida]|uniref:Methyl transferase n=1 Tax=Geosmithia morbida TaxID=1094350 RepID=A0A9P4YXW5_9HYPO|nr:uncharacterized protein GMORB2_3945 [Geosmithia morbida]KAF4125106.1 hypothetical protein GMORB2_3945 [Geosmithia morbida]
MELTRTEYSTSEERYLLDGFWRHGRYYGSWKPGKYIFPIDSEELNRLDIFHKVFLVARDGLGLDYALRKDRPVKILDVGTGTGIWSIHVSEHYQHTEVMAVDLNQVQPHLIPAGMRTMQFDIEEPSWDGLMSNCDLVHIRLLYGSIQTNLWPQVYRNVFGPQHTWLTHIDRRLAPGTGFVEHTEIDWTPRWESSGDIPNPSAIQEWSELYLQGMDRVNKSARVAPQWTVRMLEDAGFVDVREETIRCYVCPWSSDRQEREIARWFNLVFSQGLEAMSLLPMVDYLGMSIDEVNSLCARTKREMCVLRYHAYMTFHIWTARRP